MSIRRCKNGKSDSKVRIDFSSSARPLTRETTNSTVDKFKELVEANGTLGDVDIWGKRRLAYPINDLSEGYYVLMNFTSPTSFPAELDRVYKITDGIMRSMIICKDE